MGKLGFYVLTLAVTVVVFSSIFLVQVGPTNELSIWLIHRREYIEAPRWADIGIVVVV